MEDRKNGFHYYLQDELGSPLRVSGYGRKEGTESRGRSYAASDYLTYGYDEFGNDLYRELEESGIPSPYDKQGEEQPFGYTGYRYDEISGTYFAQAREYQPESGRFTAEDVVRGNGAVPETLNRYGYCWGDPVGFVDNDGKMPNGSIFSTNVVISGLIGYILDAYESYEEQREQVPAPEMPSDTSGLPDYTKEIDKWLEQKETLFNTFEDFEWPNLTKDQNKMVNASITSWIFYNQVQTGGPMDIKLEDKWEEAFGFEQSPYFIYHGEVMDPGTLGNVAFGYVGAPLFPDFMLYCGGGAVNMKNWDAKYVFAVPFLPNYGDAPEDYIAVKKGIEMWNEKNKCID